MCKGAADKIDTGARCSFKSSFLTGIELQLLAGLGELQAESSSIYQRKAQPRSSAQTPPGCRWRGEVSAWLGKGCSSPHAVLVGQVGTSLLIPAARNLGLGSELLKSGHLTHLEEQR